jgi:type VI secretion system protein ImpH
VAGAERQSDDRVTELLEKQASEFGFFQAVQLLHRLNPNATPIGGLGPPSQEPVRFKVSPSLIFAASDVESIVPRDPDSKKSYATLTARFLGLTGASSPLANNMVEEVLRDAIDGDGVLAAFYDIFHHRVLSLYFRAWKKYRFSAGFRTDGRDAFTQRALAFVGVDPGGVPSRDALPPATLLAMAPLLSQRTRSARTLHIALERLLPNVGIHVESFVERFVMISPEQRVKLALENTTLCENFTIGRRVYDRSGRFRVCVGPVDYQDFEELMPGGPHYPTIRKVIEQFSRGILEAELEVTLKEEESPRFQLGNRRGALLGTTTQLLTERKKPMKVRVLLSEDLSKATPQIVTDDDAALPEAAE